MNANSFRAIYRAMAILGVVAVMLVDQGYGSMHGHPELSPPYNSDYRSNEHAIAAKSDRSIASAFVRAETCYQAGFTWQMCFSVHNATADGEWLDLVRLTFPTALGAWSIACKSQNATDSAGYLVNLTCNVNPSKPEEVMYTDNDIEPNSIGEISPAASWEFCIDATIPAGYTGPRILNWGLSGDEQSGTASPHDITGTSTMEVCRSVMLAPLHLTIDGCNGIPQTRNFEIWNNTGANQTFLMNYNVSSGNALLDGPASLAVASDARVIFAVTLEPDVCLDSGETVTATVNATNNGDSDTATITQNILDFSSWDMQTALPVATFDHAVAWAKHDGGLWSIGGLTGLTQRYDPPTQSWTTHTPEPTPQIQSPMDGCYGLDDQGHEVVVLFPDSITTPAVLHRYDITDDAWDILAVPTGFPGGRYGQDIVSLYNITGDNLCYISGGAASPGGGNVNNLWSYNPANNITIYLGNFTYFPTGFNQHASWYVPWIGTGGAICVGGGLNYQQGITRDTQCYDLALSQFNAPNADLGQLPELWYGMADGWSTHRGRHQIWIANGMDQNGTLLWASAYADRTTGGFVTGPLPAMDGASSEGDGWNGQFYVLGGVRYYPLVGIAPQVNNQTLEQCFDCGAHYYVAPAPVGNDSNPGNSPVSPLESVQTAENKAQSGVVDTGIIYVASGGYADTVVCDASQGLTVIGGWNANFTDITGSSVIHSLELRAGAVTISDIIIQ